VGFAFAERRQFYEAQTVADGTDVSVSASVVTHSLEKAMLRVERIESGVVKVNQISTAWRSTPRSVASRIPGRIPQRTMRLGF